MALAVLSLRPQPVTEEPVGNVNVVEEVFRAGVLLQDIGDGDFQVRDGGEFGLPVSVAIDIGKGCEFPGTDNGQLLGGDLGLAAGDQPKELGEEKDISEVGPQDLATLHNRSSGFLPFILVPDWFYRQF